MNGKVFNLVMWFMAVIMAFLCVDDVRHGDYIAAGLSAIFGLINVGLARSK